MALFRSLIRIFSGQTTLNGLACPIQAIPFNSDQNHNRPDHPSAESPLRAIELTNDYIAQNHGQLAMFATVFFGVLDPSNGILQYINGGHEPPLIIRRSGGVKESLPPTGPAVGVQPGVTFDIRQTTLQPGDIFLGYTDGVTEARNTDDVFFNQKRMLAVIETPADSAENLLKRISAEIHRHVGTTEQFDDITMLAIRHTTSSI